MQAVDLEVLTQVRDWLVSGQSCWLCTVVQTFGSSPRPVGSLLTCRRDGAVVGSLSGGCVEDDLLEKLRSGRLTDSPTGSGGATLLKYGLAPEDTERLGLPCGGHLHVLAEPLTPNAAHIAQFNQIVARLEARRCVKRTVVTPSGEMQVDDCERHAPLRINETINGTDGIADPNAIRLEHTYGPRFQLFIIGSGMVSSYLAQMAQALDYQVSVCDPREHLLEQWRVAGTRTFAMMPDDAVRAHANDHLSAIVAVTHDPRIDDMGLMEALQTDAFYVGAMGSEKTSANRRLRLKALDLTDAQIARLRAPVGLPIGSKTPPEIAVAILAELIAVQKDAESRLSARLQKTSIAA